MATEVKERYSDAELAEFKALIKGKIAKAQEQLEIYQNAYKNDGNNGTDDTSPTFKAFEYLMLRAAPVLNVLLQLISRLHGIFRRFYSQLAIRQEKFIRDLKNALNRIENKTYGICRVTGKLIAKERLKLVPHATLSIEAKNMQK